MPDRPIQRHDDSYGFVDFLCGFFLVCLDVPRRNRFSPAGLVPLAFYMLEAAYEGYSGIGGGFALRRTLCPEGGGCIPLELAHGCLPSSKMARKKAPKGAGACDVV